MRTLTGLQPSGQLHIGNYFGAILPALELQEQGDAYFFIADYHAMTSMSDASTLKEHIEQLALDFLACGFDPNKATIYRQSAIPEVHELAWILSTVCPMGLLERCHSYKDKIAKGLSANHALFAYPVLMAADILLYDAQIVPVGKDQKQHVEVTRDLAGKINEQFGADTFIIPKAQIRQQTAIVPGLDGAKMSKSYHNTLPLIGEQKPLRKLIMKITTDSAGLEDPKPTENSTIIALYRLFAQDSEVQRMIQEHQAGGLGYGHFKQQLFDAYWEFFKPIRTKRIELENNRDYIEEILQQGASQAREVAHRTLERVKNAVGLS